MDRELKSKVMGLGNRLSVGMGRHEAFCAAWRIVKNGGIELSVRGTSFLNRQEALKRLTAYSPELIRTFIAPEKDNPADNRAVAVYVGINGGKGIFKLGFLPKEFSPMAKSVKGGAKLRVIGGGNGRGALVRLAV
jgi:hypothetical protein